MGELVELQKADLGALPLEHVGFGVEVAEGDLGAGWPTEPEFRALERPSLDERVKLHRVVPQPAFVRDLDSLATEDHGAKSRDVLVPEAFEEFGESLATTSCTTIDDDVGARRRKRFLRAGLGPDLDHRPFDGR